MKKIILLACSLLLSSNAMATDITSFPALGTPAAATDGIVCYDSSSAAGSRATVTLFDNTATNYLNGQGGWSVPAGDGLGSAAAADVVALWTTCTGYLKSDGTCDTPAGGVDTSGTPVQYDMARFTDADTLEGISYAEFFALHDDITWGAAAGGSQVHTFDTGAGTDPTMTVSDTDFTFNKPVIASSFSAPGTASGGQYIYFLEDTDNGTNYLGWGIYGDVSASRIHIPPLADPTAGQVMAFAVPGNQTMGDGTTKIASVGTWITPLLNVVEDTTPQLGGNLDLNTNEITVKDADWLPIEWAEDGSTAPAAAAAITGTTRKVGRAFDGAANEDVTFIWRVPTDFTGTTVTARVTGVVSGATAPANTEVVAFSVALACYANSEASTLAVGTAQTTSLTADATYAQYDNLDTAYSSAITPAGSIAAGEECAAAVIRLATTTDTYAQDFTVTGVEFKYSRALSND